MRKPAVDRVRINMCDACMQGVMLPGLMERMRRTVLQDVRADYFRMQLRHMLPGRLLDMFATLSMPVELDAQDDQAIEPAAGAGQLPFPQRPRALRNFPTGNMMPCLVHTVGQTN